MVQAIQDEDSKLIMNQEWSSIHAMAIVIACNNLAHLNIEHYWLTFKKGPKAHYKCFYKAEWADVLKQLESAVPLLSLCSRD